MSSISNDEPAKRDDVSEQAEPGEINTEPQPEAQVEGEREPRGEEEEDDEEPDDGVPRVLVTGASGYIALQVTKRLLQDGRFRVRGSVRNKKKKAKIQPLLNLVPDAKYPLRLVQADLEKPESWKKAIDSCSYVFHLASPFPAPDKPQSDEILTPLAVEGTLSVLRACAEAGTVKRVVLTSSIAAISSGSFGNPGKPADYLYSESDWSDESNCTPYERSKYRAERAAWDFMQKLEEDKKFELVVLNPGYVQGPLLSLAAGDATKRLCVSILSAQIPGIPDIAFPFVDVRDIAAAHIAALEKPEAAGNRYALVSETVNMRQVARIIAGEFRSQGYSPPTIPLPKALVWVAKLFDNAARNMYPYVGKVVHYNNEKMRGELGITLFAVRDTIIDTCYSLIELGVVRKTQSYLGHPSIRPSPPTRESAANGGPMDKLEDQASQAEQDPSTSQPGAETGKDLDSKEQEPENKPPPPEPTGCGEPGAVTGDLSSKEQPEHDTARANEESPTDNEPEKRFTQESETTQS